MKKQIPVRLNKGGFYFESCHNLVNYDGPCSNCHGHSYHLQVEVEGCVRNDGLVVDFSSLKDLVNEVIISKVDHKNLNEVMPEFFSLNESTTCENMILAFWWKLDHAIFENLGVTLTKLELNETVNSKAVLTRDMVYTKGE